MGHQIRASSWHICAPRDLIVDDPGATITPSWTPADWQWIGPELAERRRDSPHVAGFSHALLPLVSAKTEVAVEFFLRRGEAERMLAEALADEPWGDILRVEPLDLPFDCN